MEDAILPWCAYPDVLYRVTSTLTWPYDPSETCFRSDARMRWDDEENEGDLKLHDQFPTVDDFKTAVVLHLGAKHDDEKDDYVPPFISATTSLQYAISVAELHAARRGKHLRITVIDTKKLEKKTPIWDAEKLASIYIVQEQDSMIARADLRHHRRQTTEKWKNEFLIFDQLEYNDENSRTIPYHSIDHDLVTLMPALPAARRDVQGASFYNFLGTDSIQKYLVPEQPLAAIADSAFLLAQKIAPPSAQLVVAINLMLLHQHPAVSSEADVARQIFSIVLEKSRLEEDHDSLQYYRGLLSATGFDGSVLHVHEFLEPQYRPPHCNATFETRVMYNILAQLRLKLHQDQEMRSEDSFVLDLSIPALIIRRFVQSHREVEKRIVNYDRANRNPTVKLIEDNANRFTELFTAFDRIKQAVLDAASSNNYSSPLSHLHDFLEEAETSLEDAGQHEAFDPVHNWTTVLQEAATDLELSCCPPDSLKRKQDDEDAEHDNKRMKGAPGDDHASIELAGVPDEENKENVPLPTMQQGVLLTA